MKYLLALSLVAFLVGCGDGTTEHKTDQKSEVKQNEAVVNKHTDMAKKSRYSVEEVKSEIKQEVHKIDTKAQEVKEALAKKSEEVQEATTKKVQEIKATAISAHETVMKKAEEVTKKVSKIDGSTLYKSCAGCHGNNGEKKALGKSEVIKGWDKAKVVEALNGYKKGTRNIHGMGGLMKAQVGKFSEEQIEALSEHIAKF